MPRGSMGGFKPDCIGLIVVIFVILLRVSFVYQGATSSDYGLMTGGLAIVAIALVIWGKGWVRFEF